jgi:hypothetical protein
MFIAVLFNLPRKKEQRCCGFVYKGRFVMGENKKKVLFETELYFLLEVYDEYQDLTSNYGQSSFYMV